MGIIQSTKAPNRDPLLHSERTQGFTADPDYWKGEVFAYVGRNQNLKDLKALSTISLRSRKTVSAHLTDY